MKRLFILLVGIALAINFILLMFSIWPYQRLEGITTKEAKALTATQQTLDKNAEVLKSNLTGYISINIGIVVFGACAPIIYRKIKK